MAACVVLAVCVDSPWCDAASGRAPADGPNSRELIQQHHALIKSRTPLTPEQSKRFAAAYYEAGLELHRARQLKEAEPYLRAALRLDPQHARATMRLGEVLAIEHQFKAAAESYARAGQLDPGLAVKVKGLRRALLRTVLNVADQRLADSQIAGAQEVLDFVLRYLEDVGGDEAVERLEKLRPLLQAEKLLNAAKQDFTQFNKHKAYAKLRQVATAYPRTWFAQEANRLLSEHDQKIVRQTTAAGFTMPPSWRRDVTAHFEIYYERRTGLTGVKRYAEKAFTKIVTDFGMTDVEWKTRITMYLFSDDEQWQKFLAMNTSMHSWAGAFAVPHKNEIYVYVTDKKKDLYKGFVPHELTHILHHRYVGGARQLLCVREGIAQFQEKDAIKEARKAIRGRVKNGSAMPLGELLRMRQYPDSMDRTGIRDFYALSATLVGFIIDEYGAGKLKEFMFATDGADPDVEEAIKKVFGITLDTFEKKWKKYVL